nr:MAG TPA: hypothetical protein [Caudoviricetes sp.]
MFPSFDEALLISPHLSISFSTLWTYITERPKSADN